jgi:hypothetical protein
MAVFNFTVRATDSEGSYADRSFNITVRNSKIERFMAVTITDAWTSADGTSWTQRAGMGGIGCAYGNGFWLVQSTGNSGQGNVLFRKSYDGINYNSILRADTNWIDHLGNSINGTSKPLMDISNPKVRYMGGKFVLPHHHNGSSSGWGGTTSSLLLPGIWISDDGITWNFKPVMTSGWSTATLSSGINFWNVQEDNGTIFLNCAANAGAGNFLGWMTSDLGTTWTALRQVGNASTTSTSFNITRFNGLYMCQNLVNSNTSPSYTYLYSTDGQNWTTGSVATGNTGVGTSSPHQFTYANGRIYSACFKNTGTTAQHIYSSADALNWNTTLIQQFSANNNYTNWYDKPVLAYKNGVYLIASYIAGGNSGSVLSSSYGGLRLSTDGSTWTVVNNYNSSNGSPTPFADVAIM